MSVEIHLLTLDVLGNKNLSRLKIGIEKSMAKSVESKQELHHSLEKFISVSK